MASTLSEKVWDRHVVHAAEGEPDLLYIDLHLVHEVTSAQAFEGLRLNGRKVRRPDLTLATMDHNVPTSGLAEGIKDPISKKQIEVLAANCREFGIPLYAMGDVNQGIVHVIGPEQGLSQPGMTIVCGDSHTSTHGAFGALAFGIGTSEVEHVLATQTLPQHRPGTMAVTVNATECLLRRRKKPTELLILPARKPTSLPQKKWLFRKVNAAPTRSLSRHAPMLKMSVSMQTTTCWTASPSFRLSWNGSPIRLPMASAL